MRASLRQIAERVGVSPQTISNVLNNRPGRVSEETRQRVLAAVGDINYIPVRRPALQNRHVETRAIGVVFMDDVVFLDNLQSLKEMRERLGLHTFAGMRDQARHHAYDLLLLFRSRPEVLAAGMATQFLDRRFDGIIFVGQCPRALVETLVAHKVPTVVCYSMDTPTGAASILADNRMAMRLAVEHLIEHGHERIAHLSGPSWSDEAKRRREEYRRILQSLGRHACAERIAEARTWGEKVEDVRAAAEEILAKEVTAVVCGNDFLALALWRIAEEKGLKVPEDLSLTGMDNMEDGAERGLTSVVNPCYQIGCQAIDSLVSLIRGTNYKDASRHLPVELVSRNSVSPRKAA
jgi:LacI family transcriptional regulator